MAVCEQCWVCVQHHRVNFSIFLGCILWTHGEERGSLASNAHPYYFDVLVLVSRVIKHAFDYRPFIRCCCKVVARIGKPAWLLTGKTAKWFKWWVVKCKVNAFGYCCITGWSHWGLTSLKASESAENDRCAVETSLEAGSNRCFAAYRGSVVHGMIRLYF